MAKLNKKKKKVKVDAVGEAHIQATFNNIIISLTNTSGHQIFDGPLESFRFSTKSLVFH